MQIRRRTPGASALGYQVAEPDAKPANILEKIVWYKEQEVEQIQALHLPLDNAPPVRDFKAALKAVASPPALIAEVKKASPSRGLIRANFDPVVIAQAYECGGASCLSVLTDAEFFQGSFENLSAIRDHVNLPLLCKEFIIDAAQVRLARSHGADAVLLIAAILSDFDLQNLLATIQSYGMMALVEVHSTAELERVLPLNQLQAIGINNRNLETFTVDLSHTQTLMDSSSDRSQQQILWVSESGIFTRDHVQFVRECGVDAILVGESLMKQENIELAVKSLLSNI